MARGVGEIDWAAVIRQACKKLAPIARPKASIVNPVAAALPAMFTKYDITTQRRQAHFLSQTIHECDYYQTLEEYASGDAYDQRTDMGFTPARDGDGRRNKGFGIIQTTGPNNQRRALKALRTLGFDVNQDVAKAKAVLTDPTYAAWVAGIWWSDNKANAVADRDKDGTLCSRLVNRGSASATRPAYHEAERKQAFKVVWAILQNPPLLKPVPVVLAPVAATTAAVPQPGTQLGAGDPPARPALYGGEDIELPEIQGVDPAELGRMLQDGLTAAPGMDPAEHQAQVAAGEQPDAAPPSPSIPLPAEPVAPGVPTGMLAATQERLRVLGFYAVGQPDGETGHRTVGAIAAFQSVAKLPVTGQLDQATMTAAWDDDAPHAPLEPGRALATAKDLRPTSEVVDATAKVKTASLWQVVSGGVAAAGTALVSSFSDTLSSLSEVRAFFADWPAWVWAVVAILVVTLPALYAYIQAQRAQKARVASFNRGETA